MRTWQLQEAKSKFSQVVDEALEGDPQIITRHGQEVAVVLSLDEYRQLLASRHPNPHVVAFVDSLDEQLIYLSVITTGEIKRGIEKLPPSPRRQALQEWLMDDLLVRFQDRLLPLDAGVMLAWGELVAGLEQHGRRLPAMDSLIVATAVHGQLALVTRNVQDFAGTGVAILNPWDDPSVSR